ncbi:SBBP repeat-containing protein [Deltaproteobacteria bacterium IMCC39524]|nr:SBBP repeat-containing protein [Deltaproteobacteria bacterium IMCC39524]
MSILLENKNLIVIITFLFVHVCTPLAHSKGKPLVDPKISKININEELHLIIEIKGENQKYNERRYINDDENKITKKEIKRNIGLFKKWLLDNDINKVKILFEYDFIPFIEISAPKSDLDLILQCPYVSLVEIPGKLKPLLQESKNLIGVDKVHQRGYTGSGVGIAIIDSGIDRWHSDFQGRIVAEACFVSSYPALGGCSGNKEVDYGPGSATDIDGHGTGVAGIAAGENGIAPSSNIVVAKINSGDWKTFYEMNDMTRALQWIYSIKNDHNIKVVNISYGGRLSNTYCDNDFGFVSLNAAIQTLVNDDITVVVASGNDSSTSGIDYPACFSNVISVGSVYDEDDPLSSCPDLGFEDSVYCTSNSSPILDLLAPGHKIFSAWISPGATSVHSTQTPYLHSSGTSLAAPHVAGLAALLYEQGVYTTPSSIETRLKQTGVPVNDSRAGINQDFPRVSATNALDDGNAPSVNEVINYNHFYTDFVIKFSEPMDEDSFPGGISLNVNGQPQTFTLPSSSYNSATYALTIDPDQVFSYSDLIELSISGVNDWAGHTMAAPYVHTVNMPSNTVPSSIDLSVSLSPDPADPYEVVTVSGTAYYDIGTPVLSGSISTTVGGVTKSSIITNGLFELTIYAPASTQSVTLDAVAIDTNLTASLDKTLNVDPNGSSQDAYYSLRSGTSNTDIIWDYDAGQWTWNPRSVFSTSENDMSTIVSIDSMDISRTLGTRVYFTHPDGTPFSWSSGDFEGLSYVEGGCSKSWSGCGWSPGHLIKGSYPESHPGKYTTRIKFNENFGGGWYRVATHQYVIGFDFQQHRMAENVVDGNPQNVKNSFTIGESIYSWARINDVAQPIDYKWEYYKPDGSKFDSRDGHITSDEYSLPSSFRMWDSFMSGSYWPADFEGACGNWKVKFKIKNPSSGVFEEYYEDVFNVTESEPPSLYFHNVYPSIDGNLIIYDGNKVRGELEENYSIRMGGNFSDNLRVEKIIYFWNDGSIHSLEFDRQDFTPQNNFIYHDNRWSHHHEIPPINGVSQVEFWAEVWDSCGNKYESEHRTETIKPETVSIPSLDVSLFSVKPGEQVHLVGSGSTTSQEHNVEYRFDYGDGTQSAWGAAEIDHSWPTNGHFPVKVQARCQVHTHRESSWSNAIYILVDNSGPEITNVIINDDEAATASSNVQLTLTCSDDGFASCSEMQLSNDNTNWSAAEPYSAIKEWTLSSGDGTKTVFVKFADGNGNWSVAATDTIDLDTTIPTGSIVIDGDAAYATSSSVTLSLSCTDSGSGCAEMQFSNDNTTWTTPEPYVASKPWTLTSEGEQVVYVQFKDSLENWTIAYSDSIFVDTIPPDVTASPGSGIHLVKQWVSLSASEGSTIYYTLDGVDPTTSSSIYTQPLLLEGSTVLKYYVVDLAGLQSPIKTDMYEFNHVPVWSDLSGSYSDDFVYGVVQDSEGNLFVAGYTSGSVEGQQNLGGKDILLVKYDPFGERLWTKQYGSNKNDVANDIALDANGDIILVGTTSGDINSQVNSGGGYYGSDGFVMKLDPEGSLRWSDLIGTVEDEDVVGVSLDSVGKIFVVGHTSGVFPGEVSAGGGDYFIANYSVDGTRLWLHQYGTDRRENAFDITLDNNNEPIVTGFTDGAFSGFVNAGRGDIYVAKHTNSGEVVWRDQLGAWGSELPFAVNVDHQNQIYVAGVVGPGPEGLDGNPSGVGSDAFLIKYDQEGLRLWTKQYDTGASDTGRDLYIDGNDDIYLLGYTTGKFDGQVSTGLDIFLHKIKANGEIDWTGQLGSGGEYPYSLLMNTYGEIIIAGSSKAYSFDGSINQGNYDYFIVSLAQDKMKNFWSKHINGTPENDDGQAVAKSNDGSILIAGNTNGDFTGVGSSLGGTDAFLVKVDIGTRSNHWSVQIGSDQDDSAEGVAVDEAGNSYVVGSTTGSVSGDANLGLNDVYLMKLDSTGGVVWTRQIGCSQADIGRSVAVDSFGNVIITGYSYGDFDGIVSNGNSDFFIAKYDSSGNKLWSKLLGTTSNDLGFDVVLDDLDNIYLTGITDGPLDGNTPLGMTDVFVTKYDPIGNWVWTQQVGSNRREQANSIAYDGVGQSVYVVGLAMRSSFDGNISHGGNDGFIVKFDLNGNKLWSQQIGTPASEDTHDIAIDSEGNPIITGYASGVGGRDIYLQKFDASGANLWYQKIGSPGFDESPAMIHEGGSLFLVGTVADNLYGDFNQGLNDVFLARVTPPSSGTILINDGATYVNDLNIQLALTCNDCTEMAFSEDGVAYSPSELFSLTRDWTLESGDGLKTLYVKFSNSNGGWSEPIGTQVYLDTVAPTSISSPIGAVYSEPLNIRLKTQRYAAQIYYTLDGSTPTSSSELFDLYSDIYITSSTTVKFFAVDSVGNQEPVNIEEYIIDSAMPTGTVVVNSSNSLTNSYDVQLSLNASDDNSVVSMQFSNDGLEWSTEEGYASTKDWSLGFGDGTKTVYARFKDVAGNWSSSVSDTIELDTLQPNGDVVINNDDDATSQTTVALALSAADNNSVIQMKFSNNGVDWSVPEPYALTKDWTIEGADGVKTVYVQFEDGAGNWSSSVVDSIELKTGAPVTIVSPEAGSYLLRQWVALETEPGATIYYTLDGSTPDQASPQYSAPILIDETKTLKYFAISSVGVAESIQISSYVIDPFAGWTKQFGSDSEDTIEATAYGLNGDVYAVGVSTGSVHGQSNTGGRDVLLVKYNSAGLAQWTRQVGGTTDEYAWEIAVDEDGNPVVAAETLGAIGGASSAGGNDCFLVKYDTGGNLIWTQQVGSSNHDFIAGLAIDPTGQVYLAGVTDGSFDSNPVIGGQDYFLVKFDSDGNQLWAKQYGSVQDDVATDLKITSAGELLLSGFTDGTLSGESSSGGVDSFLIKYNGDGQLIWNQQFGTSGNDTANALAAIQGSIAVAGTTRGAFSGFSNSGGMDAYVLLFDPLGNAQWVYQSGSGTNDVISDVSMDSGGNVYFVGSTSGEVSGYVNAGGEDVLIGKLDSSGSEKWLKLAGSSENDYGASIVSDELGKLVLGGASGGGIDGHSSLGGLDAYLVSVPRDTYVISVSSSSGGSVSLPGAQVYNQGDTPNFVFIPDVSYGVVDVKVDGMSQGVSNSHTFSALGSDHTLYVEFADVNDAPEITSTAKTLAAVNATYSYSVVASDLDTGDTLTLSATTLPAWLTFDVGTGLLSGVPSVEDVGNHSVTLQVSDDNLNGTQDFVINVLSNNSAPLASSDVYDVDLGQSIAVGAPGVLNNDIDADEHTMSAVLASGPAYASSFTLNADGSFSYQHDGSLSGNDSFSYKSYDEMALSNAANVVLRLHTMSEADREISVSPDRYLFGEETLNDCNNSRPVSFIVKNSGPPERTLGSLALAGYDSTEYAIVNDNCSGQTLVEDGTCTVDVKFCPSSVGSKSAILEIPSDDPETPVLVASLYNHEDIGEEAARRMPPVLETLSIPAQMTGGTPYTLTWSMLGYDPNYYVYIAFFDCSGLAAGTCGDSYGSMFEASSRLSPVSVEPGDWIYDGEASQRFNFNYEFTPPAVSSNKDIVIRFYRMSQSDLDAGRRSLSLLIPGNLPDANYYDDEGRRLQAQIVP